MMDRKLVLLLGTKLTECLMLLRNQATEYKFVNQSNPEAVTTAPVVTV
jgi:hypothetical protein